MDDIMLSYHSSFQRREGLRLAAWAGQTIHAQHGLLLYTQVHRYVRTHKSDDIEPKVTNLMIHQICAAWQDKTCASTPYTGGILIDF
jgi:hypothetical protein